MKIIYIAAAIGVVAFLSLIPFEAYDILQNEIIDLPNLPDEVDSTEFIHWHAQLNIIIDGKPLTIPANIGIKDNEHAVIHTHEPDNILHIEQFPNDTTMKIGYFFDIWAYQINKTVTFNSSCILDRCNDRDDMVIFTVNGERNEEYENYVIKDEDVIRIDYKKRNDLLQSN